MSKIFKRVIKFRVWDQYLKTMVYSDSKFGELEALWEKKAGKDFNLISESPYYPSEYYPYRDIFVLFEIEKLTQNKHIELMQYTGLEDINGKEIYEGDIISIGDKNILYFIEWHDNGLEGWQIGNSNWIGLSYWKNDISVVGNKFENPELLERGRI